MEITAADPSQIPAITAQFRADFRICAALALLCLLVYNANWRAIPAGDTYPARFLPFAILGYGTLTLDPVARVTAEGNTGSYWIYHGRNGHLVSLYPVVTPILVTPLYLPAVGWLHLRGWTDQRMERLARLMEKISASVIASLSALLMYLLLRRRLDVRTALLAAIAFAFGTNTWVISSQALWQHGAGELLLVAALFLVTGPCTAWRAAAAGAACALTVFNRPPDVILAAALGLYALWWAARRAPLVVAGAAVPIALFLWYNIGVVGNILGGYAVMATDRFFGHGILSGIAGLLCSPARGLFVFTPFLLFIFPGLWRGLREREGRGLFITVCAAVVIQVLMYARTDWRAGCSWGPRFLTDMLPLLMWLLVPFVKGIADTNRFARGGFIAAVCGSVVIQAIGAFWYNGSSDGVIWAPVKDGDVMAASWKIRNTGYIFELRHNPAARDLLLKVTGHVESVSAGGSEARKVVAGTPITVFGWALADDHPPWTVLISMVPRRRQHDTRTAAITSSFTQRPDLAGSMNPPLPFGWSVVVQTTGLEPGAYIIDALSQGTKGGDYRPLDQIPFTVLAK